MGGCALQKVSHNQVRIKALYNEVALFSVMHARDIDGRINECVLEMCLHVVWTMPFDILIQWYFGRELGR